MAGRPSKYLSHVKPKLELVEAWARDGLTDEQIAGNLGISRDSFIEYKKQYSEFSDILNRGKEVVDYEVEGKLLQRAMGYEYEEKTQEYRDGELITTKIVTKQVAPDVAAQIFWLKNRKPKVWRDKVENAVDLTVNSYSKLTDEELRNLAQLDKTGTD